MLTPYGIFFIFILSQSKLERSVKEKLNWAASISICEISICGNIYRIDVYYSCEYENYAPSLFPKSEGGKDCMQLHTSIGFSIFIYIPMQYPIGVITLQKAIGNLALIHRLFLFHLFYLFLTLYMGDEELILEWRRGNGCTQSGRTDVHTLHYS